MDIAYLVVPEGVGEEVQGFLSVHCNAATFSGEEPSPNPTHAGALFVEALSSTYCNTAWLQSGGGGRRAQQLQQKSRQARRPSPWAS